MKTFLSFLFILFLALQGKSQIKDNFQKSLEAITLIGEELNHIVKFYIYMHYWPFSNLTDMSRF